MSEDRRTRRPPSVGEILNPRRGRGQSVSPRRSWPPWSSRSAARACGRRRSARREAPSRPHGSRRSRIQPEGWRDRKSVVKGESVAVRVDLGGCLISKTTNHTRKRYIAVPIIHTKDYNL